MPLIPRNFLGIYSICWGCYIIQKCLVMLHTTHMHGRNISHLWQLILPSSRVWEQLQAISTKNDIALRPLAWCPL